MAENRKRVAIFAGAILLLALAFVPSAQVARAACSTAGTTGLTAAVVATHSGEDITGLTINAAGCDLGIYVGPGINGVTIKHNTITGANDHGIFIQDSSGDTVQGNTVTGNGVNKHSTIAEDKAIELSGTSNSVVKENLVKGNMADGGIGLSDDGAIDPGAPNPGTGHPGNNNLVKGNTVINNALGCGIVVASYNAGEGVSGNTVQGNTVMSTSPPPPPFVGGIVLADDTPGTSTNHEASPGNQILGITVSGSLIPGIIVHANAPYDDVANTLIKGNTLANNGCCVGPNDATKPVGINIVAEVPGLSTIVETTVQGNSVSSDYYGSWYCNTTPSYSGNTFSTTDSVGSCPSSPGTGPGTTVPEFPFGMALVLAVGFMLLLAVRKRFSRLVPASGPF